MEKEKFDFEEFARQAAEQLKQKKPLTGNDGVFTPLLKRILEAAMEGEMDAHLEDTRTTKKNRRNGRARKNIQSSLGGFEIFTPRDRNATFEPMAVEKRQTTISTDIDRPDHQLIQYGSQLLRHPAACWGDVWH
ncbi:MAG: transposase [Chitinophagales bacterium]